MSIRSSVASTRLRAAPAPEDPAAPRGEPGQQQSQPPRPGAAAAAGGPAQPSPRPAAQRSTGAYTLIAPNETRRQQIQKIAEQELVSLEKWKEQNRAKPIHLVPRRLGGSQSESEVRQKQQLQLMQSKYQQKLKREEFVRIKKEAEEAELQKMKALQREKSNKLEEKRRLQENLRREAFREHHQYKTAEFLSRLDTAVPNRSACPYAPRDPQSSMRVSSWAYQDSLRKEESQALQSMKDEQHRKNKLPEPMQKQQEEERAKIHQTEHKRVNNAFLDRLQGKSQPGGLEQTGGYWNMNSGNSWGI